MKSQSDKHAACPELVGKKPPGFVVTGDDIPREMPLVSICKPPPIVLREMLYDLIRQFGTQNACEVLGFRWSSLINPIGDNVQTDRISACTTPRAVWMTWSIFNCPSNLTPIFNLITWGIHNPAYVGEVPDAHRAVYNRKVARVSRPTRDGSVRRKNTREARDTAIRKHVAAELAKLPANDRRRNPRRPERKAFIAEITKTLIIELRKKQDVVDRKRQKTLRKSRKRTKHLRALVSSNKKSLPTVHPVPPTVRNSTETEASPPGIE